MRAMDMRWTAPNPLHFAPWLLAVFSLVHGFCFVPWVLPCYRPEKERFSSQELSFPIISALREFSRRNALACS
jgi:hypothetical protein